MKILKIAIIIFLLNNVLWANYNDSLDSKGKGDIKLFESYIEKANDYISTYPDSTILYGQKVLKNLPKKQNIALEAKANRLLGLAYAMFSDLENSMKYFVSSLKLYEKLDNKRQQAVIMTNIANIYGMSNEFQKSIDYNKKSIRLFKTLKTNKEIADSYYNIAIAHHELDKKDSSFKYLALAEKIYKKHKNTNGLAYVYMEKSKYYIEEDDSENSIMVLDQIMKLQDEIQDNYLLSIIYQRYAETYLIKNDYEKSEKNLLLSTELAQNLGNKMILNDNYSLLSIVYEKLNNLEKALYYQKLKFSITQEISEEKTKKTIEELKISYDIENKNKEIEILSKDNKLNEIRIQNSQKFILLFVVIIVLIIIVLIVFINRYKLKNRSGKLLEKQNEQLIQSNKTKDRMFSIISHDIRNPFAAFQSITHSLYNNADKINREELNHYATSINDFTSSLTILLDNLLFWAKSQSGKLKFQPAKTEVSSLIKKTISLYSINASVKNIDVVFKNPNLETEAYCDPNMLKAIVRNLLNNAIKYTRDKGTITISITDISNKIKITVLDNGIGLSNKNVEKLNKQESINHKHQDTEGLGLEIIFEFLKYHNTKLVVESEIDKGSAFSFILPKS